MLHHPDGPLATALLAVEGRADATLAEVIAIEAMLRESWDDPAVADFHAEREEEARARFDPQRDALEEAGRGYCDADAECGFHESRIYVHLAPGLIKSSCRRHARSFYGVGDDVA